MTKTRLVFVVVLSLIVGCTSSSDVSTGGASEGDAGDAGTRGDASDAPTRVDAAVVVADASVADAAEPVDANGGADREGDELDAAKPSTGVGPDAEAVDAAMPSEDDDDDAGTDRCVGPPGLYADAHCEVLAPGVRAYTPQFGLWADGADKHRFIYLPPGTKIDTRNPNRWAFPPGTVLYKTFSLNGVRLETRVFEKVGTGTGYANWNVDSYAWTADQRSVTIASTNGVRDALGTTHDVPSTAQCRQCHNMQGLDPINGFGAIQLNHDGSPLTLRMLLEERLLSNGAGGEPNVSLSNATLPGDETARAGLGYLHANCGHCHGGPTPRAQQQLWSVVGMTQLSDTPLFQTALCRCLEDWTGRTTAGGADYLLRVAPGHSDVSGILGRMSRRGRGEQMPPVGTTMIDPTGIAAVTAFIDALDATSCDATPPDCTPFLEPEPSEPPDAGVFDDDAGEPTAE